MLASLARNARLAIVVTLIAIFGLPQYLFADNHIVTKNELQQQMATAARERQAKVDRVQQFFGSATAQKALKASAIDYKRVQNAVAQLDDSELSQLAAKTDKAQQDFAAGALTNQQITYILIALATAVIVLILV
ncbi:MAG TPA: hypothetical protein VD837_01110 [Terriglobales bacterium]|nr:hypothetical protein [Terriglobales bacterium]